MTRTELVIDLDRSRFAASRALASPFHALRRLSSTGGRLRLARAVGLEPAAPAGVVLLDDLSGLLYALGPEVLRHG
ncbi:hypothetical protein ABB55_13975 [Prosthecomicrobium hirschii]|uniref:Uncharacterized protein n=1 Tax=Prosthecodimorpha hirschii TaxID=665126 RepID=A0A0P6VRG1_9HYPH|nr:hypothetical protein ABB55_13975 [Prosthecomicrobium hirschii]